MSQRSSSSRRFSADYASLDERRYEDGQYLGVPPQPLVRRASSRGKSNRLCSTCSTVNFDRYLAERMRPKQLGLVRNVLRRSYCPFCRLVAQCLDGELMQDRRDRLDHTVVVWTNLSWEESIEILGWDGARSSSYSNKHDLRSVDREHSDTRPYRFLVGLQPRHGVFETLLSRKPEAIGSIQYLAEKERQQADRVFFGRTIQRERVDVNLVRSWLDRCGHWHRGRCDVDVYAASGLPRNLRFIDIMNRRVVKASSAHEYVALSYVWGEAAMLKESGISMPKLLRQNIRHDSDGAEFMPLPAVLPRTLEDAITVARKLGYQYLWNDALCIIQDDDQDTKQIHLQAMDAIYSRAALTIAAASGHHADCGLPGISAPRRYEQYREKVNGLNMASMFPSFSDVEDSETLVWNTRGWTLQEKLLSKRILFFTDWQVYFKCSEAIWTEEVRSETGRLSKSIQARPNKYGWAADRLPRKIMMQQQLDSFPQPRKWLHGLIDSMAYHIARMDTRDAMADLGFLVNYAALVERFSRRQLSHQEDSLFAIEGILKTFNSPLYAGIPGRFFREALLWRSNGVAPVESIPDSVPSWSWTICCSQDIKNGSDTGTAVVWWQEDDLLLTRQTITKGSVQGIMNMNKSLFTDLKILSALQPVTRTTFLYKGQRERISLDRTAAVSAKPLERVSVSAGVYQMSFRKPLLCIQTWILSLGIETLSKRSSPSRRPNGRSIEFAENMLIVDDAGKCCGEVTTCHSFVSRYSSTRSFDFLVLSWGTGFGSGKPSLHDTYVPQVERTTGTGTKRETVVVDQEPSSWGIANVLLLAWSGDIAYRVGIGKVVITAWEKAKPREESVILG